jgi:type VI protein secretion system component Hcp
MKKLLSFALLFAAFVILAPSAFAVDATGGTSAVPAVTATMTGTSATGEPVRMEVEVEVEDGVQVITITPETSSGGAPSAATCGGKTMPKLECPAGYAVGCNPTGGEHWACVKSATPAGASGSSGTSASGSGAGAGKAMTNYLDQDDDGDTVPTILEDDLVKAAIYIKLGDIKGESTGKAKGNVDYGWKVEEGESMAASDMFLKFPPIEGDSGDAKPSPKEITVNAVKVRGWDPKKKQEVSDAAPKSANEVKTEAGLALFVAAHAQNDERLEQISLNFEKITMKYSTDGKLIGFIPTKFTQEVSLENSVVKVKLPWFSFLLSDYVGLEDIEAAAQKKKDDHKNEIEIASWSLGSNNTGGMASGGGAGSGKVNVAVGDVNGDGRASTAEDFAGAFAALSEVMKATYDLAVQKKM